MAETFARGQPDSSEEGSSKTIKELPRTVIDPKQALQQVISKQRSKREELSQAKTIMMSPIPM
jgi:hypothetical protein